MGNVKQISYILVVTVVLVAGLGWWVEMNNREPEVILDGTETIEGPLTPEELEINQPVITNEMNRIAVVQTNRGVIEIELFEDLMPVTTGNFIKLSEEGFYDGTKFHRIIDGFMIQAGDPNTKTDEVLNYGRGGPGYTIQDEFVEGELLTNTRGTIAMANTGQPNSGGSQFFINTVNNTSLDFDKEPLSSKHPVFGRVVNGMDVVDAISSVETNDRDLPIDPVVIESVTIKSSDLEEVAE